MLTATNFISFFFPKDTEFQIKFNNKIPQKFLQKKARHTKIMRKSLIQIFAQRFSPGFIAANKNLFSSFLGAF